MAAMAHLALDRTAACGLIVLELLAKAGDLARSKRVDREMIAIVAIGGDFGLAQHLGHVFSPGLLLAETVTLATNAVKQPQIGGEIALWPTAIYLLFAE